MTKNGRYGTSFSNRGKAVFTWAKKCTSCGFMGLNVFWQVLYIQKEVGIKAAEQDFKFLSCSLSVEEVIISRCIFLVISSVRKQRSLLQTSRMRNNHCDQTTQTHVGKHPFSSSFLVFALQMKRPWWWLVLIFAHCLQMRLTRFSLCTLFTTKSCCPALNALVWFSQSCF